MYLTAIIELDPHEYLANGIDLLYSQTCIIVPDVAKIFYSLLWSILVRGSLLKKVNKGKLFYDFLKVSIRHIFLSYEDDNNLLPK